MVSLLAVVAFSSIHAFILSAPLDSAPFLLAVSKSSDLPPAASNSALASALQDCIHPFFSSSVAVFMSLLAVVAFSSMHAFILSAPLDSAPFFLAISKSPGLPPAASNSALASALQDCIHAFFSSSVAVFMSLLAVDAFSPTHAFIFSAPLDSAPFL